MKSLSAVLLVVGFVLCACPASLSSGANASRDEELKTLPSLSLRELDGKAVAPDDLKGHIVVLDIWATWCGPCIAEIPALNRLHEKYAGKGVKVVGVTVASGDAKEVKAFVNKLKMKYRILMGDDNQVSDLDIFGFPTTFLVNRDSKIVRKFIGVGPTKAEELDADIQKLLQQTNP